jgi:hypothetical protein
VPFFTDGGRGGGVPPIGGLDADALSGVLPPCVLATLANYSCVVLSPKRPACDNEAFSHVRAPR